MKKYCKYNEWHKNSRFYLRSICLTFNNSAVSTLHLFNITDFVYKGFFYFLFKILFNLFLVDISKMLRKLTRSWKKCWNISHKLWILIWRSSNIQSLDILKPKGTVCVISNDFLFKDSNAGFTMVPFIWSIIWKKLSFF